MTKPKGRLYEEHIASIIRHKMKIAAVRDNRSGALWWRRPDIRSSLPLHIEVKHHETLKPKEWFRQARDSSGFVPPAVVFKCDEDDLVLMRFTDVLDLLVQILEADNG